MNMSTSECSSGCESGWTTYLDQSSYYSDQFQKVSEDCRYRGAKLEGFEEDEAEDLSMVSDASSGPPHLQEVEECINQSGYFCYGSSGYERAEERKKKEKKKTKEHRGLKEQKYLCLDDTASSPVKKDIGFPPAGASMDCNFGYSQGFSATHFKGKSTLQKQFGFFQSSVSGSPASGGGGLKGRKWGRQ
ncbi:hypothetical protein NMG60_11031254 [Bertholletia excelsa]